MAGKKPYIVLPLLLFCFAAPLKAQKGDSLIIHLKNGTTVAFPTLEIRKITFDSLTDAVPHNSNSGHRLDVGTSFPNPVIKTTEIEFTIAEAGNVGVTILDSKGNTIRRIIAPNCFAGKNRITWNGHNEKNDQVEAGAYFYEVRFKREAQTKKMIVVK